MNIADIFQAAKDHILANGEHHPMLYAELATGGVVMMVFADFPYETTVDKQKALFGLARKMGKEYPGDELRQVCFVVEAWMSYQEPGQPRKYAAPSEDPARKEMITASVLDIDGNKAVKQSLYAAEMLRDGSGALVDLLPHCPIGEVTNKLLIAFLVGFASAQMSDGEFAGLVARYMR